MCLATLNVLAILAIAMAIIMASVRRKPESEPPKYVMRIFSKLYSIYKLCFKLTKNRLMYKWDKYLGVKRAPKLNIVILLLLFRYIWR